MAEILKKTIKAVLYCRVSTEIQGDAKTAERQLYELRNYTKQMGYEVVKEYQDVISGTIMKRLELDQLKEDAKNGMFQLVLVSELSRISRGDDAIVDVILLERELEASGVKLYLLDGSSDNEIIKMVKAIEAKSERRNFLNRSINGRMARAKRNSVMGTVCQYGYTYAKRNVNGFRGGVWEVNQEEAKNVNLILDLYIELQSQRKVLRELAKRGIKPRNGRSTWRGSSFRHILTNSTCATGIHYYKEIPINVPKIVSKEKWDRVQQIMKERSNKGLKVSKYLLGGGLVRCSCGSAYSGEMCKGVKYYRCNNRHATFPEPRTCQAKMLLADKLEASIWDYVSHLMENPKDLQERMNYLSKDNSQMEKLLNEEKESITEKLDAIEKKKGKFLDLYGEDQMSKEKLLSKVGELSKEEETIKQELMSIENRLAQINKKPFLIKNVEEFCRLASRQMNLFTFEQKQEFLRMVIRGIKYDYSTNSIFIDGYIPDSPIPNDKERVLVSVGTENLSSINYGLPRR